MDSRFRGNDGNSDNDGNSVVLAKRGPIRTLVIPAKAGTHPNPRHSRESGNPSELRPFNPCSG
jgi:hypothetical protein